MLLARGFSAIVLSAAAILAFFTAWARLDTLEEISFMRWWDVFLGLVFAFAFLLAQDSDRDRTTPRATVLTVLRALAIWVCVSGSFLCLHEWQVRVRSSEAARGMALVQIEATYAALQRYRQDCGIFPSEEQGLRALCHDPVFDTWVGPYLEPHFLVDRWEHPLRYGLRGNVARVWSSGPDGQTGTGDDIDRKVPTEP